MDGTYDKISYRKTKRNEETFEIENENSTFLLKNFTSKPVEKPNLHASDSIEEGTNSSRREAAESLP